MAQFHVGQRVRVIGISPGVVDLSLMGIVGKEGIIVSRSPRDAFDWKVCVPNVIGQTTAYCAADEWLCMSADLAPLTDPAADQFIERIKRLGREPINAPEKVTK